ncbi:MAG TPA: isoprenylcysteine carboxylmethyltransferase family protein [Anaeromyxobacteraceae bacterium]|nr:isoprenylcysteine carboxylmethyltransferase family protein [Anaeromyxobacteraceae bacterium]
MTPGPAGWLRLVAAAVTAGAATVVAAAVLFNFLDAARARRVPAWRARSPVATGTMTAFFVLLWALLRFRVGAVTPPGALLPALLATLGALLVAVGAAVNVAGRSRLGGEWANQPTVYADHRLVTGGVFGVVRHPLYGSLAWMALGASIEFANPLAALAVAGVFVPMMVYRARQEERALEARFPEYAAYRRRVGMLFPRLRRPPQGARS